MREEAALHAALGATRRRLSRQAMLEGLGFGGLGTLGALALAVAGAHLLGASWPDGRMSVALLPAPSLILLALPLTIAAARAGAVAGPAPASELAGAFGLGPTRTSGLRLAALQLGASVRRYGPHRGRRCAPAARREEES